MGRERRNRVRENIAYGSDSGTGVDVFRHALPVVRRRDCGGPQAGDRLYGQSTDRTTWDGDGERAGGQKRPGCPEAHAAYCSDPLWDRRSAVRVGLGHPAHLVAEAPRPTRRRRPGLRRKAPDETPDAPDPAASPPGVGRTPVTFLALPALAEGDGLGSQGVFRSPCFRQTSTDPPFQLGLLSRCLLRLLLREVTRLLRIGSQVVQFAHGHAID